MIKSIIFDWGGVIIDSPSENIMSYCSDCLKVEKNDLKMIYSKYKSSFQKGILSEQELWRKVCFELNVNLPERESLWKDAFIHSYHERNDILSVINRIKENGYKIGFISNTETPAMEFFKELDYRLFDVEVFSCVEGVCKPQIEIYEIGLRKLDVLPEESIFIDDRKENIATAKKLKINTIIYVDFDQFTNDLREFSIDI